MKKIILIMALLLIASPAMAAVTVTCSEAAYNTPDYGDGVVTVNYAATGNDVRAFAFDVNAVDSVVGSRLFGTDVAVISAATRLDPDYFIHPGSTRLKDPGATIRNAGTVNAASSYPGTLGGLGTDGITTEQASLYEGANSPGGAGAGSSGDLFSFVVDANATVQVRENTIRTGVVMEDPDEDPALTNAGGVLCSCTVSRICWGDIGDNAVNKGADDNVNVMDLFLVINAMNAAFPTGDPAFMYPIGMPAGFEGMDVANGFVGPGQDGQIDIADLFPIVNAMNAAFPTGDPAFMYNIGCQ